MSWIELEYVVLVMTVITSVLVFYHEATKIRTWYRNQQDIRVAQLSISDSTQQLTVIRSPPPALLPIYSHPAIELNTWETQGTLGEGTRLEDSGERGDRMWYENEAQW
ncbi:hypothetical protein ASPBRDRAFT_482344 [Aspergillus brasiliensis CBS 101740]|uniref:Uncharacterized protein n=1 Tax=Aspergillus brasiliensis (strain CBS 101740 / IMI 381727 / IBT 21946) TaxID=767769 RepID=A0A1L9UUR4_ASPBC|nr:hypothetical protein ASPBRDRAFT_482344 [Aspergillus brasiliensis CBS 101740]